MFTEINGDPEAGVRIPGDGRFMGILEVTHQLHCVEIMRVRLIIALSTLKDTKANSTILCSEVHGSISTITATNNTLETQQTQMLSGT
jgi:hypothetical protein